MMTIDLAVPWGDFNAHPMFLICDISVAVYFSFVQIDVGFQGGVGDIKSIRQDMDL